MGLVVLVRFAELGEAQIACSALRSAGIPAVVADETYGSVDWELQVGLQGFRLAVPVETFNDAAQVLLEARRLGDEALKRELSDIRIRPRTVPWIIAGLIPGVVWPEWGFFIEAARRRPQVWGPALITALAGGLVVFGVYAAFGWEDPCEPGSRRAQSEACLSR